ncbi:YbaY family lipoprotein [Inquilinus sp.]|jgi:putative lipoprotein|uniref:YbaY family lipoprotein n=1 Tax=Inquilinus sp. TaxID=1932117 RepID=UPI0037851CC3
MNRLFRPTATLVATLILAACGPTGETATPTPAPVASATVTGSATYRERIALPADAELIVQLVDVSLADAPSTVVAEQRIAPVRVPADFTLSYDPARIDQRHSYAVSAKVERAGTLLFVTDTRHPVLTQGGGNAVDIVMTKARSR